MSLALAARVAKAGDDSAYCGLYAVYGASAALGTRIDFARLIDRKYIGPDGSSAGQLVRAARDFGLSASAFSGLGLETLRRGPYPMILHVASGEQLDAYNHWILCCGCDGAHLDVVDALDGRRFVLLAQILARWDGNAIFVGARPASAASVRWCALAVYAQYCVIVLAVLASATYLRPRLPMIRRSGAEEACGLFGCVRQLPAIITIGVALGLFVHAVDSTGFFRNRGPTSFVAAAHIDSLIPSRSLAEIKRLAEAGDVLLVDARFARDYERGHVSGAVSLPIDARPNERAAVLSKLPRDREIVVYCQTPGCHFKDVVATALIREGFARVSIFPGGWVEWRDAAEPSRGTALARE